MSEQVEAEYSDKGRGLLAGGMAQLTVFFTGLALTVLSYFILSLMIGDVVQQDSQAKIARAHQDIHREMLTLRNDVVFAADIISRASTFDPEVLKEDIILNMPHLKKFDALYLLMKEEDDSQYSIVPLYVNEDAEQRLSITVASLNNLKNYFLSQYNQDRAGLAKHIQILSEHPGNQDWQEFVEPVSKGRNFTFLSAIEKENKSPVFLAASLNSNTIFNAKWLQQNMGISRVVLKDMALGTRLYYMNRKYDGNEDVDLHTSGVSSDISMEGSVWRLNLLPGKDPRMVFLNNMPYLMLFFGLLLTSIGTFYIRNNQKQSYQLAAMNKALAQKNYELNSEVAERERLNQSLRKAEREYKAIVDSVSDIIFEVSIDGNLLFLNGTWDKVAGVSRNKAVGQDLFDMLHPEDRTSEREKFDLLVQGKKSAYRSVTRLQTGGGAYRTVELAVSMIRQDENKNMRVVGTVTDIEERRRAEKALREAEKKYRTIVENAAGGIYQMTPEGKYISANPAMARILGYENSYELLRDISNAHQQIYAHPEQRFAFISDLETTESLDGKEFEVVCKNGKKIWVNENARVVKDDSGNTLYIEGSLEDITSRKKAEEEIKAAMTNSEIANRAKTEFLANMSHELRTPLNAIIGFAEIIKDEVLGPVDNKQYWEYARDIHESGRGLLSIINEILDVARIEAGERQLNEGVVVLSSLSKSCIEFIAPKVEERQLSVKNQMSDADIEVMAEERAMKQIMINLLSNAVKFTPDGGRITLSCEAKEGKPLRISITDTGTGMEDADIAKALSPFGQIDTAHSRSGSGAGLGLTLVNALVALHDGKMEIFSQKGIGTTVTVELPAERVIGRTKQAMSEPDESEGGVSGDKPTDDGADSTEHQIH